MKTRPFLCTTMLAAASLFVFSQKSTAQSDGVAVIETISVEELPGNAHFYSERFGDNMYISLGAGTQTFFTDHWNTGDNSGNSKFTLAMNFAVGKWFTPYIGGRISAMGGALHYAWPMQADVMTHMRYFGFYGDMTFNLSNLIWGYNPDRFFSIVPFAGIGYNYAFKNTGTHEKTYAFPVSGGLTLNFRLSHYVDFFIEGRANILGDHFNGVTGGRQVESIVSAVGGFTYKFGRDRFKAYDPYGEQVVINDLNNKVNQLRAALDQCQSRECPPCPEAVIVQETAVVEPCSQQLTSAVRFSINSSKISDEEAVNIYNIAQWMNDNPDCSITVAGYADKETGTAEYNMQLSQKRAEAVKKILIDTYKIDPTRIQTTAGGSATQPYPHNNWNRVVIFSGK
ncbi:MAG: OmpA family protein [Bacteroidaceae bacterium]|nr:OmpA family protein [Bacteroidaceae bacterium]